MKEEMKCLIVDDEEILGFLAEEFIRVHCQYRGVNIQIFTAESAEAGMEIIKKHQITLLVSDLQMPGESGDSFIRRVSKQSPRTLAVLMSGYPDYVPPGDLPIIGFLKKPFQSDIFRQVLDKAFENMSE